jgi:predicted nucleic acid-binding protein
VTRLAVDTSVAIPLLVETHRQHSTTTAWSESTASGLCLSGHALAETYSVLTRLPGDIRVTAEDAASLIRTRFESALTLDAHAAASVVELLATAGVTGGAVYDGLVALAARNHELPLATRDARAAATYARLGIDVRIVPSIGQYS